MKSKWLGPLGGIAIVAVLLIAYGGCKYNSLVNAEEDVEGAWAQVENQLKRRADLIPNLVETVKGFASHEKEVIGQIAEARSQLLQARGPAEAADANAGLSSALSRLLVISENYPQLRANENFVRLQDELAGTENRIAVERKRYNDMVVDYNKSIRRFPGSIFAGMFGFDKKEYFEVAETDKANPKVKF